MYARPVSIAVVIALAVGMPRGRTVCAQIRTDNLDVIIKTVEEGMTGGRLVSLSLRDGLLVGTDLDDQRRVSTSDLVRITTAATVARRNLRDITLMLAGGDVLYGRIVDGDDDSVVVETMDLGRLSVPLDTIVGLDFAQARSPAYRDSVAWVDRAGPCEEDYVMLANGDVVRGFLTSIDAKDVVVEGPLGEARIPHRFALAVRLATLPAATLDEPHFIVTFRNSGRLRATNFEWSQSVVEAGFRFAQRARIEAERIVRVDVEGGRWEWLAQHRPISSQHTPMLSLDWPYVPDRNVLGGPIIVNGESFEHGVGVHSRSSLTYDLRGAYREFVTSFGIDDDSGPYADVSVSILVDGKRRFAQEQVRRGRLFGPVRLDVTRMKRIELIVDFGDNGGLQDRFNWVDPALIR